MRRSSGGREGPARARSCRSGGMGLQVWGYVRMCRHGAAGAGGVRICRHGAAGLGARGYRCGGVCACADTGPWMWGGVRFDEAPPRVDVRS
eukprot:1181613-Prorocentrum_minimum.AAC.1